MNTNETPALKRRLLSKDDDRFSDDKPLRTIGFDESDAAETTSAIDDDNHEESDYDDDGDYDDDIEPDESNIRQYDRNHNHDCQSSNMLSESDAHNSAGDEHDSCKHNIEMPQQNQDCRKTAASVSYGCRPDLVRTSEQKVSISKARRRRRAHSLKQDQHIVDHSVDRDRSANDGDDDDSVDDTSALNNQEPTRSLFATDQTSTDRVNTPGTLLSSSFHGYLQSKAHEFSINNSYNQHQTNNRWRLNRNTFFGSRFSRATSRKVREKMLQSGSQSDESNLNSDTRHIIYAENDGTAPKKITIFERIGLSKSFASRNTGISRTNVKGATPLKDLPSLSSHKDLTSRDHIIAETPSNDPIFKRLFAHIRYYFESDSYDFSHIVSKRFSRNSEDIIKLDDNLSSAKKDTYKEDTMRASTSRYEELSELDRLQDPRRTSPSSLSASYKKKKLSTSSRIEGYTKLNHPYLIRRAPSDDSWDVQSYASSQCDNRYSFRSRPLTNHSRPILHRISCSLIRGLLLIILVGVCCLFLYKLYESLTYEHNYLGTIESPSELGKFDSFGVSTDAAICAPVGKRLLAKGGSAVDAAIGTLICMGVVIPNSLGLGGGCLMTLYDRHYRTATIIDGREVAPDYATETMFMNNSLAASRGPLSIAVPGEVAAYWEAHKRFGKLKWAELFEDSIKMAKEGIPTPEHLAYALRSSKHAKYITPDLAKIYTNPHTKQYVDTDDTLIQEQLGATLQRIAENGQGEFYGGPTGQSFIKDLQAQNGKMTIENLISYKPIVKQAITVPIAKNLKGYTQPPPGSGVILGVILRVMAKLGYYRPQTYPGKTFEQSSLFYHHLTEAFKFAYAQRAGLEDLPDDPKRMEDLMDKLQSEQFIDEIVSKIDNKTHDLSYYGGLQYFSEDHGTAHVSVVDAEGNAAAITSSVNLYFGSGLVSPSTGIVYNDVMDDFVSPNLTNKFRLAPSKFNHIKPGRRPLSSMAPTVYTNEDGEVVLVIGASGGSKITSAIASVSIRNQFLGEDLKTAIDGPRVHHQYIPNTIMYENNFPNELLDALKSRGHQTEPIVDRSSVVMAVAVAEPSVALGEPGDKMRERHPITANSDHRKRGAVDGA